MTPGLKGLTQHFIISGTHRLSTKKQRGSFLWVSKITVLNSCGAELCTRTYIFLDGLLCSIAEYLYEFCRILKPVGRVKIPTTIIYFSVSLSHRRRTSQTCSTGPGVQISRDSCTRFGRYLCFKKCSWIIRNHTQGHIIHVGHHSLPAI